MLLQNLSGISTKINELKALFIFGQRVLPFLEELFQFVQEVIPLLDEINASVKESTSKMPRASSQLSKVTKATELAATEILDTIDSMLFELGSVKRSHEKEVENINKVLRIDARLMRLLREEIGESHPELITKVDTLRRGKRILLKETMKESAHQLEVLNEIHDKTSNILMSLQVQDITSQQIAAVNHLIESIEQRLGSLIEKFKKHSIHPITEAESSRDEAYNPDATYDTSGAQQQAVDEVFNGEAEKEPSPQPTNQNEIDKLFSQNAGEAGAPESIAPDNPPDPEQRGISGAASQDEIDKLFGN